MDFSSIWQENRTFITYVIAGLLLLIIGKVIISEMYPVDGEQKALQKAYSDIKRLDAVSPATLADAADENDRLTREYTDVLRRIDFVPREEFLLQPNESAVAQYLRLVSQEREVLVEFPKTQNMTVDENLGMPELSPTRKKEIQHALLGLDVVDRVVSLAIESNIREVGSIELVAEPGRRKKAFVEELRVQFQMTGTAATLAAFLEKLQLCEEYLAVERARLEALEGEGTMIEADFTVAALTVLEEQSDG